MLNTIRRLIISAIAGNSTVAINLSHKGLIATNKHLLVKNTKYVDQ